MYPLNNNYKHPAVPPLYPMDPCRPIHPEPMPYDSTPYEPMPYDSAPYGPMPYEPMPYDSAPYGPMPYEPMPYDSAPYGPMPHEPMPHMPCPMMDPALRDCIRVCMMQCGNHPMPANYPMNTDYNLPQPVDINEFNPYYQGDIE